MVITIYGVDNCRFSSGKYIYLYMIARYFEVCLKARSCTRRGLLQNRTHWCMAIDIYGRFDP